MPTSITPMTTLERSVEIHSSWGTFEWLAEDAFKAGYRVASSATATAWAARRRTSGRVACSAHSGPDLLLDEGAYA